MVRKARKLTEACWPGVQPANGSSAKNATMTSIRARNRRLGTRPEACTIQISSGPRAVGRA
jgi:hypothetical protein